MTFLYMVYSLKGRRVSSLGNPVVSVLASRCYSNFSNNDDETMKSGESKLDKSDRNSKNGEVVDKLNKLLMQMAESNNGVKSKLKLAKPFPKRGILKEQPSELTPMEERLKSAAKDVANKIGGDEKRTESELLSKLTNITKTDKGLAFNLSSIMRDMKIDRDSKSKEQLSRAQQVKQLLNMTKQSSESPRRALDKLQRRDKPLSQAAQGTIIQINISEAEPLRLFTKGLRNEGLPNEIWKALHKKELQLAVTHPPTNYFQQMIQWTEAGKIWKFPIDNEQGMEVERTVYFTEHVFLEKQLDPWCPSKGPVRHFMELVCVGLSKNPYMTVETKKEHIDWYKKYFEDKMQILKEVGAIPLAHQGNVDLINDT